MKTILMLLGAAATYVACAMPVDTHPTTKSSSTDNIAPAGESGSRGGSSGAWVDAMTDPVPTAEAATAIAPDVAVEECKPSGALSIAEHLYPGKSITDLASVRVVLHYSNASLLGVPGYENLSSGAAIRDGSAAISCGGVFDRVTFILPAVQ